MPIIIREFRCGDCGETFESTDPVEEVCCPTCSAQEAERVFLTPPSIKSPATTFKDNTVKQLAADYGLSNMSNAGGAPVRQAPSGPAAPQFAAPNPQISQALAKLGGNADGFSSVLPALQSAGGPRNWAKVPERH
jgi:putative FmdB family regulatory protein